MAKAKSMAPAVLNLVHTRMTATTGAATMIRLMKVVWASVSSMPRSRCAKSCTTATTAWTARMRVEEILNLSRRHLSVCGH